MRSPLLTSPPPHVVRVSNRYDFLSTSHVELQWRLMVDGRPTLVRGMPMPMVTATATAGGSAVGGKSGETASGGAGRGKSGGDSGGDGGGKSGAAETAVADHVGESYDDDDGGGLWDRVHQPGSSPQRATIIGPRCCSDVALPITLAQAMGAAQALQVCEGMGGDAGMGEGCRGPKPEGGNRGALGKNRHDSDNGHSLLMQ